MAQLDKSFVRLRFSFGKQPVKGRQRYENTAAYVSGKIAVAYADEIWKDASTKLVEQIDKDVRRELVHIAYQYRRYITGLGGTRSGVLTSAVSGAQPLALSAALPAWAPRNADYLRRKAAGGAGRKWFNNSGWRARRSANGRYYPVDPGRLVQEVDANLFEKSFGPVKVSVRRDKKSDVHDADGYISIGKSRHIKLQVAKVTVQAMPNLTPAVLSTLRTGNFSGVANPAIPAMIRKSGVAFGAEIANRLGPTSRGRYRKGQHGPYRPTLEPFLGYYLQRSIPAAVDRRIVQGSLGRVKRGT